MFLLEQIRLTYFVQMLRLRILGDINYYIFAIIAPSLLKTNEIF